MSKQAICIAAFLALALIAGACAPGQAPAATQPPAEQPTEAPAEEPTEPPAPAEAVTIQWWHAMGGELGEAVTALVADYNASQDEVEVVETYQGSYDDNYNALLAAFEAGNPPHMIQNFDLAAQTMIDTERIVPIQQFIDADPDVDSEVFIDAVRTYYSDERGTLAMPFNSSTPIIYYNAEMLEEAGVGDLPRDWTFSDFLDICQQIQESGVAQFCFTFGTVGWYFEQITANSGGLYFNADNGRTDRATEAVFNEGEAVNVFSFLTGLMADGFAPRLGNTWSETDATFIAEQAAIMIDSSAGLTGITEGVGDKFTVRVTFIPHSDTSERNGVIIGGAANWLLDQQDDALEEAAWKFLKWLSLPDQTIFWHVNTGYFPVRKDVVDDADLQAFYQDNPNQQVSLEQLLTTNSFTNGEPNHAVRGGLAGPFPAIRQMIVDAYSRVLDDGLSPQAALDEAKEKADGALAEYNRFIGE